MSCTKKTCGIEGWGDTKSGDPSNDVRLSATSEFGGIMVSWALPSTNPHAIAYVRLYRGTSNDFSTAVVIANPAGDRYFDPLSGDVTKVWFYWITTVSVNGTIGPLSNFASAVAKSSIDETIRQLSGRISASALNGELTSEIAKIPLYNATIQEEIQRRMAVEREASLALGGVQDVATQAIVVTETLRTELKTKTEAAMTAVTLQGVAFGSSVAGLAETVNFNASKDSALGQKLTTLDVAVNGSSLSSEVGLTSKIDSVTSTVNGMYTAKISSYTPGGKPLIGGFGIANNGTSVDAIFNVNTFAIGGTDTDVPTHPFIVTDGKVYMHDAVVGKIQFKKLVDETGAFMVENGKLRASAVDTNNLVLSSGTTGGRMVITKDCITVYDDSNNIRVKIGNLS